MAAEILPSKYANTDIKDHRNLIDWITNLQFGFCQLLLANNCIHFQLCAKIQIRLTITWILVTETNVL